MNINDNNFGIMAGYFLLPEHIKDARQILKNKLKISKNINKNHITDLKKEEQKLKRKIVFDLLKTNKTIWTYQAIYNKGFTNYVNKINQEKSLLHSELFIGIFVKAIAYIYDNTQAKDINLKIISDTIDNTTKIKLKKAVQPFIDIITNKKSKPLRKKVWNKEQKKLVDWKITHTVEDNGNLIKLNSLIFDINCEDTELTFVADILANSTYYYLKNKIDTNNFEVRLNSIDAISEHPLSKQLYGIYNKNNMNEIDFNDTVYRQDYNKT